MEREGNGDTNCNWFPWNNLQRNDKETRTLKNLRNSTDHPDYNIIKIGQNTGKCPGDLKRLAVSQTPTQIHQLTLVWKTLNRVK